MSELPDLECDAEVMETTTAYFIRRAKQQRLLGAASGSPKARLAHVELALRLVNRATDLASWRERLKAFELGRHDAPAATADPQAIVSNVLVEAFPLPASGAFGDLLKKIDATSRGSELERERKHFTDGVATSTRPYPAEGNA